MLCAFYAILAGGLSASDGAPADAVAVDDNGNVSFAGSVFSGLNVVGPIIGTTLQGSQILGTSLNASAGTIGVLNAGIVSAGGMRSTEYISATGRSPAAVSMPVVILAYVD